MSIPLPAPSSYCCRTTESTASLLLRFLNWTSSSSIGPALKIFSVILTNQVQSWHQYKLTAVQNSAWQSRFQPRSLCWTGSKLSFTSSMSKPIHSLVFCQCSRCTLATVLGFLCRSRQAISHVEMPLWLSDLFCLALDCQDILSTPLMRKQVLFLC